VIGLAASGAQTQGAATKAKAKPECPKNALCLWDEENYEGQRVVVKDTGLSNKIFDKMNDLTSSVFLNRKDRVAILWTDFAGQGAAVCLHEENRWRNNKLGAPFDDSISSTKIRRNVSAACDL
jgi:hypothetical protein